MKYTSLINNVKTLEWGITLSQAFLVDLITMSSLWAERETIDEVDYYWVSRNKVLDELPHVFNEADTVYRALKELHKKGIIDYKKIGKKDVVRLTQKGLEWSFKTADIPDQLGNNSEFNGKLGNKSEQTRKKIRVNSEKNPTDNITINNITKDEAAAATFTEESFVAANDQTATATATQNDQTATATEAPLAISEHDAFQALKIAGIFPMFANKPNDKHFKPEIFKFNSWFEGSNFKTNQLRTKLASWFQRIDVAERAKFYTDEDQLQQVAHPSHRISQTSNKPAMTVEEQRAAMQRAMAKIKGGNK